VQPDQQPPDPVQRLRDRPSPRPSPADGGPNPVWYLDITPGHDRLTGPIQELRDQAVQAATPPGGAVEAELLAAAPILRLTPFIEQMRPTRDGHKEFWWQREWRRVGDLVVAPHDIVVVFVP
jgi:hypothetical protein